MIVVSVIMITYGHEQYIQQALEGVLMQEVDFKVELIVANDSSPDNTDGVVQRVVSAHPNADWVSYTRHEKNLGMMKNFIWALSRAKGKYIALCEGDDYWTDPMKLQKQVNFLEHSTEKITGIFHDVNILVEHSLIDSHVEYWHPSFKVLQKEIKMEDVLRNNFLIPTCSILFKADRLDLPDSFFTYPNGDFIMWISLLQNGNFLMIPERMAVYRKNNPTSITNKRDIIDRINIRLHKIRLFNNLLKSKVLKDKEMYVDLIDNEIELILMNVKTLRANKFIMLYIRLSKVYKKMIKLWSQKY